MEIHHHSHQPLHSKKKWTHYFWEFIMLFLAVFCGFLAENQREHMIEHRREKEFIASFVKDVQLDTASMHGTLLRRRQYIIYFDSLFHLLKANNGNDNDDIYLYSRYLLRSTGFQYHDRTILQLKNSGGLRLIRNKQASDSITIYDNEVAFSAIDQQNAEQKSRDEIFPLITKIFDASVFEEMVDNTGKIHRPIGNPKLASTSSDLLNEFAMHIHFLKTTYRLTYEEIQDALQYAERLITFLKTEYHLK